VSRLSSIPRERYGHLRVTGLREIGHGLDARVYRGSSATLRERRRTRPRQGPVLHRPGAEPLPVARL